MLVFPNLLWVLEIFAFPFAVMVFPLFELSRNAVELLLPSMCMSSTTFEKEESPVELSENAVVGTEKFAV
jgi:hypothetical protein